jgi:hypothetical protein
MMTCFRFEETLKPNEQNGNHNSHQEPLPFSVEISVKESANLIQRGEWIKMANLVKTSNNDQPAVSDEIAGG